MAGTGGRGRPCPVHVGREQAGVSSTSGWSYCPIATDSGKENDKGFHPGLLYQPAPLQGGLGHGLCVVSTWDWWETLGVVGRLVRARSCLSVSVPFLHLSPFPVLIPDTQSSLPPLLPPPSSFSSLLLLPLPFSCLSPCLSPSFLLSILLPLSLVLLCLFFFQVYRQLHQFYTEPQDE